MVCTRLENRSTGGEVFCTRLENRSTGGEMFLYPPPPASRSLVPDWKLLLKEAVTHGCHVLATKKGISKCAMSGQHRKMQAGGKKHLSMLRSYTIADLFTIGNASCGTISIFLCLNYIAEGRDAFFWIAFVLLFAALFCDVVDGYWARRSGRQSVLGADLDSLADIVSFGVAPAVLGFT